MFDGADSSDLPDFLIDDDSGFDPEYADISHLLNWDPDNGMALLNVVKDLLRYCPDDNYVSCDWRLGYLYAYTLILDRGYIELYISLH